MRMNSGARPAVQAVGREAGRGGGMTGRLLIIDDDTRRPAMLRDYLSDAGHAVRAAATGRAGRQQPARSGRGAAIHPMATFLRQSGGIWPTDAIYCGQAGHDMLIPTQAGCPKGGY